MSVNEVKACFFHMAKITVSAVIAGTVLLWHPVLSQAKELKKVTIAVGSQVLNVTYPWLTLPVTLGYWRDEGYDVQVIGVSGSLQALQQMATGGVEFAELNASVLVQANVKNKIPVRGVMGNGIIDSGIAVMDDSGVKDVKDFKGKRIGIFSLASGTMQLLKGLLLNNGLTIGKDVQIIVVGAGAPALEALKKGRVDGLMFWQTALTSFENSGAKIRVFRNPEWHSLPDYTLATMQATIDTDPAMVEAIVRGAAKAILYASTNPECARQLHWANYPDSKPTGADPVTLAKWDTNLLKAQIDGFDSAFKMNGGKFIGAMDPKAYSRFQDFMFDEKMISGKLPAASFLINQPGFIEAVNKFDHQAVINAAKACNAL